MFAWARKRVSRRAKRPSTNQSLLHRLTEPRSRTDPNRWADRKQFRAAVAAAVALAC